jgi:LysW-gamma-L-lysine/LysW-L-ornithine aminotransferase
MTWEPKYREPFEPLTVPVDFVRYDDVAELEAAVGDETAMIWLEPVQGEGGVHAASAAYLRRARELADEHGALLGFDEIQCGVGAPGASSPASTPASCPTSSSSPRASRAVCRSARWS